jgi:uncharacterized protein (TIGR03663 family)
MVLRLTRILALAMKAHYLHPVQSRWFRLPWLEISILLLAVALRLLFLDIKPAHFDEGINGWFADQMKNNGYYHYDPTNYHGPLHFYAVFLSQNLFGRNLWALRMPAIIASILSVWALLRYREFFGATTTRIAAAAMALSPAYVFYGRYSIHESWMVLFSILFLWGLLGLWQKGERRFLFTIVLAFTGMVLTKETYVVHVGCFALAAGVLWFWQKVFPSRPAIPIARQQWTWGDLDRSAVIGLVAIVFFYSGNFLDWPGLKGLYETFAAWIHTGVQAGGHEKNACRLFGQDYLNYYWTMLMTRYEWPALAGLVVGLRYVAPSDARLRYIAISAGGILVAYSIIPYKTPWCIISILWPFYLLLGAMVEEVSGFLPKPLKRPGVAPTLVVSTLLLASLGASIRLNFFHYTDEKEPYVYVQTYPEIATLTTPLLEMAKADPRIHHLRGQIVLDSYYPLPWMLGDFTQVGYYSEKEPPSAYDGDFIVVKKSSAGKIETALHEAYYRRPFRLRDSQEDCVAYFRSGLFQKWFHGATPEIGNQAAP